METKKLTTKDLMIGDYMKYKDGTIVRIARVGDVSPMDAPIYCHTQLEGYFPCQLNDISPIPLTSEILEKNGIKNHSEIPEYVVKTNEYEIWVILDEPQNCVHVEKYDKSIPAIYHNKILFFHELQHALRLCGIEKNIII